MLLALVPYYLHIFAKSKKRPKFKLLITSMWILIVIAMTSYQIYKNNYFEFQKEPYKKSLNMAINNQKKELKNITFKNMSGLSPAESVYNKVFNSVYAIDSKDNTNKVIALGSAVAITSEYLVTNCHIIAGADHFTITINRIDKNAKLYSAHGDICIVSVDGEKFIPVTMRSSKDIRIGEVVYAIGNPEGLEKSISNGIISNKHDLNGITILQTNASISPGSSGGGLFDRDGRLIGITEKSVANEYDQNINIALPIELIQAALLEPLIENDADLTKQSNNTSTTDSSSSQNINNENIDSQVHILGVYGDDKLVLASWYQVCFILIPGRYGPNTVTSYAVWMPNLPYGLYIFSRISRPEGIFKFFKWRSQSKNVTFPISKSYIFYNNTLSQLTLFSVDNVNQPVYIYAQKLPLTEDLVKLDHFIAQFYNYTGEDHGLTTIQFGLDGFTEALQVYNQNCNTQH